MKSESFGQDTPTDNAMEAFRVLVVDEDQTLAELHAAVLQGAGMAVVVVTDPAQAAQAVTAEQPDVALIAMQMAACPGTELAERIRRLDGHGELPMVFLAEKEGAVEQIAAIKLAGDDVLRKPVDVALLPLTLQARALRARKSAVLSDRLRAAQSENARHLTALNAHAIVSVADVAGRITFVNDKFCDISGYRREELLGQNHRIVKSGHHPKTFFEKMWATITHGDIWHGEVCNHRKDGGIYWVESTIVPFLDEKGRPYQYISIRTDITHLKFVEERLRVNEERFRRSQIYANIGTWDWDIQTGDLYWSERIGPLFGYPGGELNTSYENFLNAVHPADRQQVLAAVVACVEQGQDYDIEHRVVWPDGSVRWMLERGDVVRDADGKPLHMLGVVQDITARKALEGRLFEQKKLLELLREGTSHYVTAQNLCDTSDYLIDGIMSLTDCGLGVIGEVLKKADGAPYFKMHAISSMAWDEATRAQFQLHELDASAFPELDRLIAATLAAGESLIADNPSPEKAPPGFPPLKNFLGMPVYHGDELVGLYGLANRAAGFDQDLVEQLRPFSSTYGVLVNAQVMRDRQIRMQLALDESEGLFRASSQAAQDAMIIIDHNGDVTFWNQAAETMFGYLAEEAHGHNLHNLVVPEDDMSRATRGFEIFQQTGTGRGVGKTRELTARHKEGFLFPVEVALSSVRIREKWHAVGLVRDISERKYHEAALVKAKEAAEQANRAKSEFLSSMSHELRTPLNAIMGYAGLLNEDDELGPEQQECGRNIYQAGTHLLTLINEVLDLAKIEAGAIELCIESVDVKALLDEIVPLMKPITSERQICLSWHMQDCAGRLARADKTRLKQALLNLLSNAVKYNRHAGVVEVLCTVDADTMRISVTDTGHGIPSERLQELFEPFNRLDAEGSDIEGTGIGLVITKQLVEMMGGTLGVESIPGEGCTFWIVMPLLARVVVAQTPETATATHPTAPSATASQPKPRLLVAEDNAVNQELIRRQLKRLGYEADVAANGKAALEKLAVSEYGLLLTDCKMPGMNGYELTAEIRRRESNGTAHLPIIALTANALNEDAGKCFAVGMDDYLTKPVDMQRLQQMLEKWLATAPTPSASEQAAAEEGGKTATTPELPIDMGALNSSLGEDAETIKVILQKFVVTTPASIAQIVAAAGKRHTDDILFQTHKLKSSAKAIGAWPLATAIQGLENASKTADWQGVEDICVQLDDMMRHITTFIEQIGVLGRPAEAGNPADSLTTIRGLKEKSAMIVDDDPVITEHIVGILRRLGVGNIIAVDDGNKALALLAQGNIILDFLLCDLSMPNMDGVEFLRHVAASKYAGWVILISGEDSRVLKSVADLAKAHQLNVLGSLEKPLNRELLSDLLYKGCEALPRGHASPYESLTPESIREGLTQDRVVIYFQPKIDVRSRRVAGVEVLARWADPVRGIVAPAAFIPVAENHGLIDEITDVVFMKAMEQLRRWREQGLALKMAVNFSVNSLYQLDLPERLEAQAKAAGVGVGDITLEVTESGLMENVTTALEVLSRLRLKGISLSIDDFGTGYSTLEQLQRIPFGELKIDRAFVNGAAEDPSRRAILESSIGLAKKLNMTVVAEGVERPEDWDLVSTLGCDVVQGYYIAKPLPAPELEKWLNAWQG